MQFSKSLSLMFISLCLILIQGCQTTDDSASSQNIKLEPQRELTPMEKVHQSPNLYLDNKPVVSPEIEKNFIDANKLVRNKKWQSANTQLLVITIAAPTLSGPWLLLGDIAVAQDDVSQAIAHYQQAIYVNKHNYFSRNRLATLLREQGDFEEAKKHYMQALESWPAYVNGHRNLGILLDLYLGKTSEALEHYKTAAALDTLNKTKEDRQLKGWIADLSRRVKAAEKAKARAKAKQDAKNKAKLEAQKAKIKSASTGQ